MEEQEKKDNFKIKAIIFMSNDHLKLDFTLRNFREHNSEAPVLVYNNGGVSSEGIAKKYNCEYKEIENIWHKSTHCGVGSFNYTWFELMFEYGLADDDFTHILFLETDVYTTKKITLKPLYDMSGPLSFCGSKENILVDYFNLRKKGFDFNFLDKTRAFPHTGCGGTLYSKNFFVQCHKNLPSIKRAYEEMLPYCFMDLLMSILCIVSNCSIGDYDDTSNLYGKYVYSDKDGDYKLRKCNWHKAMVHHIKYKNNKDLFFKKIKSTFINNKLRSSVINLYKKIF